MKNLFFTFVFLTFGFLGFANDSASIELVVLAKIKIVQPSSFPSGSGIATDSCGNSYELLWSCNYSCNALDVSAAIERYVNSIQPDPGPNGITCSFTSFTSN